MTAQSTGVSGGTTKADLASSDDRRIGATEKHKTVFLRGGHNILEDQMNRIWDRTRDGQNHPPPIGGGRLAVVSALRFTLTNIFRQQVVPGLQIRDL